MYVKPRRNHQLPLFPFLSKAKVVPLVYLTFPLAFKSLN